MVVAKELYKNTKDKFDMAGIDSPAFNSMRLIERVFGVREQDMICDSSLSLPEEGMLLFDELVEKRLSGVPLQYLLGEWEFFGCRLKVGQGVLIPRDDTEVVLRACLEQLRDVENPKILDLCSGSGAIAIAIAKQLGCEVFAVEKDSEALPYLRGNVSLNEVPVKVIEGDIFNCVNQFRDSYFDLIVSNPPYIKTDEISTLQKEVQFEPKTALDGGKDGLDFYRMITACWKSKLRHGGVLAMELGEGQFDEVAKMMSENGFEEISACLDLGSVKRAIVGKFSAHL